MIFSRVVLLLACIAATPAFAADARVRSPLSAHVDQFHAALAEKGASPDAHVALASPEAVIILEDGADPVVESATFNAATGRFLLRARGAEGTPLVAVVGVAATPVTLPVLARSIERNEAIGEEDIDWIETTGADAVQFVDDASLLVGKIARRPLAAGQPLRKTDVAAPILVKRGETATIVLEAPGLRLTQSAVALASGGAGDVVAFRNLNSDREFKAVVKGKLLAEAPFRRNAAVASLEN